MALILADRVRELTATTGTDSVKLIGSPDGFETFAASIGDGNTTYYTIADKTGDNWEVGVGTYRSTGNLLERTTVLSSSNGGNKVAFTAGDKDVFVTLPAEKVVSTDAAGTMAYQNADAVAITGGTINGTTIGSTTPAAGTFTTLIGGKDQANYGQLTGGETTKAVEFKTLGSDTNVALALRSQGTGAIDLAAGSRGVNISNGGTVTAITRTAAGSNYTSMPTMAISAPTTAGGVQAVATPYMAIQAGPTLASGGSGYSANDVLSISGATGTLGQITVNTVTAGVITTFTLTAGGAMSAIPSATAPVSFTGGTGTGATFNIVYQISSSGALITTAGSGYVEQPTVTFSGGGGGSGAAAYATVGGGAVIRSLGATNTQSIDFHTPASITNGVPAVRIRDVSVGTTNTGYLMLQNGNGYAQIVAQGPTNAAIALGANGNSPISLNTNGTSETTQMRVAHTASAVNYVQVTGAATTGRPIISAQGSDANISLGYDAKGTGGHNFKAGGNTQVLINNTATAVNSLNLTGSATGTAVPISVTGTDTNIDLALTPKGTGLVRFGTYTAGAPTATGYISIKAADGTTYKVLVGT